MKLPDKFRMTDNGKYSHEGVEYICEPNKYITATPNGDTTVVYDDDYNPIGLKLNGVRKNFDEYNSMGLVHYWNDPRYFLNNCELISLQKYGLSGGGYVVKEIDAGFFTSHKVVQVDSGTQFTSYVFNERKNGGWEEMEPQRWVFTIHLRKPIKEMSPLELKDLLVTSINDENYELAVDIREEQRKRYGKG